MTEKLLTFVKEQNRETNILYACRLPAGYCFVEFKDGDAAQRAMLRLNGKIIPNSQPVGVAS